MGVESTQAKVRFPLARWALWSAAPAVGVAVLECSVVLVRREPELISSGVLAFVTVGLATFIAGTILAQASARGVGNWALTLLLAQGTRLVISLALAVGAYLAAEPRTMTFWMTFLALSLAMLVGEVAFCMKWIGSAHDEAAPEEPR